MRKARAGEPTDPQIIMGVPDETYHGWQHLANNSTLKTVRKLNCRSAYDQLLVPWEPSPAKQAGTALHLALLQPDEFESRVVCGLGHDRRSNANKQAWADHEALHSDKIILKQPDFDDCFAAAEIIKTHPLAMSLLEMDGVQKELTGIFLDKESGLLCKFKLDLCGYWKAEGGHNVICDLKTTSCDLSDNELERDIGKFGYDQQAAFYTDGMTTLQPVEWRFLFLFINVKIGQLRVIELTSEAKEHGRLKFRPALNKWAKAVKSGVFPGWPAKITKLGLKPWDMVSDFELDQQLDEALDK